MFNGTCKWRHVHIIIILCVRLRRFSSLLLCFLIGCLSWGVLHCGVLLEFMLYFAALRDPGCFFLFHTHQKNIDSTGV